MNIRLLILIIVVGSMGANLRSLATTVDTRASSTARGLQYVIAKYLRDGGDLAALSMKDVLKLVDIDAANSSAQGSFEDRFEVLGMRGPVDSTSSARLIALTAYQVSEDRRETLGRYAVWYDKGEVYSDWQSEDRVKSLMASAKLPLPNKGIWTQPDTKQTSSFHVNAIGSPPIDKSAVLNNQAGRRVAKDESTATTPAPGVVTAPKQPDATKPLPTIAGRNEAQDSTPWAIVVVMIVAAVGLLWWLLRRRQ
jgi:hypothetical protein